MSNVSATEHDERAHVNCLSVLPIKGVLFSNCQELTPRQSVQRRSSKFNWSSCPLQVQYTWSIKVCASTAEKLWADSSSLPSFTFGARNHIGKVVPRTRSCDPPKSHGTTPEPVEKIKSSQRQISAGRNSDSAEPEPVGKKIISQRRESSRRWQGARESHTDMTS